MDRRLDPPPAKRQRAVEGFATTAADLRALVEPVAAVFGIGGTVHLELSDARLKASRFSDTGTHAVETSFTPANAAFARTALQPSYECRVSARAVTACLAGVPDECYLSLCPEEGRLCVSHYADGVLSLATSRLALHTGGTGGADDGWEKLLWSRAPLQVSLRALAGFARRADDLSGVSCSFTQEASEDERHAAFLVLHCETSECRSKGDVELRVPISYDAVSESECHRVEHVPVSALSDACFGFESVARPGDVLSLAMAPWGVLLAYSSRGLEVRAAILRYPRDA